jgi:tetratricopeptide (TPR) repeat protein
MPFAKMFFLAIVTVLVLGVAGCTTYFPVPDTNVSQRMTPIEARKVLKKESYFRLYRKGFNDYDTPIYIKSIKVDTHKNLVFLANDGQTYSLPLSNLTVSARADGFIEWAYIVLNNDDLNLVVKDDENGREYVKRIANAIFVLKQASESVESDPQEEANFAKTAREYRAMAVKPGLPEEARRLSVQAEDAVQDKNLDDAADLSEQAIHVAPWWPAGHFNYAVILSETGDYGHAVREMKRYLLLVPDAPDAQAVQNYIYKWERKADTSN